MVQLVQIRTLRETKIAKTNARTICKKRIFFQAVKTKTPRSKNHTHAETPFCWQLFQYFLRDHRKQYSDIIFAKLIVFSNRGPSGVARVITLSHHFHDLGIFGRVQTPHKTNIIYLWRHQDTSKKTRKILEPFQTTLFYTCRKFENPKCWHVSKRRAPTNDEDPRKQISQILDMYFISIKKHEMEIWWYVPNIIFG